MKYLILTIESPPKPKVSDAGFRKLMRHRRYDFLSIIRLSSSKKKSFISSSAKKPEFMSRKIGFLFFFLSFFPSRVERIFPIMTSMSTAMQHNETGRDLSRNLSETVDVTLGGISFGILFPKLPPTADFSTKLGLVLVFFFSQSVHMKLVSP